MSAITDWAFTCRETSGPGWYLAGDAAAFLDPLLSSGASMAMLAGYSASVCIHTAMTHPEREESAAEFYRSNYRQMYEVTRDFLHYFYAGNLSAHSDDLFWKARSVLQLSDNVGACQAFCFLVNTLPGNPHPALKKQIHMYEQFMEQLDHPMEEMKSDDGLQCRLKAIEERTGEGADAFDVDDSSVLVLNGAPEQSWTVDGTEHQLQPVHGIAYDGERPVFSSTSSWLLGRNIVPLDDEAWELAQLVDGHRSWSEVLSLWAAAQNRSVDEVRAPAQAVLQGLAAERLVVLKAGLAS